MTKINELVFKFSNIMTPKTSKLTVEMFTEFDSPSVYWLVFFTLICKHFLYRGQTTLCEICHLLHLSPSVSGLLFSLNVTYYCSKQLTKSHRQIIFIFILITLIMKSFPGTNRTLSLDTNRCCLSVAVVTPMLFVNSDICFDFLSLYSISVLLFL